MNSSQNQGGSAVQGSLARYPVTTVFALLVLAALAYLVVTRLFFGRISIEAGTR